MVNLDRIDATVPLLRDGYRFLGRLRERRASDIVDIRLLGIPATCVGGADGAELFYDGERLQRGGALPKAVQRTLFGLGAIHTRDDEVHLVRKAMFCSVMTDEAIAAVATRT